MKMVQGIFKNFEQIRESKTVLLASIFLPLTDLPDLQ